MVSIPALRSALERTLAPGAGSAILHVHSDRARNVELHREVWSATARAGEARG